MENAHRAVEKNLNTVEQLEFINNKTLALLDELERDPGLKLKAIAEIRNQIKLQLEIFQSLYGLQAVQEFQNEVLSAIREVAPDVRNRIINNLKKKRAVRSTLKII